MVDIVYTASPTLARFHASNAFYRGVLGPVGSGKSTAMCTELMRRGQQQAPGRDGARHTRFAVVRNTYRELADTTLKTWLKWIPEDVFGDFHESDMTHRIQLPGTRDVPPMDMEVLFRALDKPKDVKKVLSLELTGAWINEAREVPKSIIDAIGDRVGRYSAIDEGGCTWRGVLMDTNAPDKDHWWYRLAEEETPEGWEFFGQPGGLLEVSEGVFVDNPAAENIPFLEPGYYRTRKAGKGFDYIRVYYCAQYGFAFDGKAVIHEYADKIHCTAEPIPATPGLTIYIGLDFGLTPAALFCQRLVSGRWVALSELVAEDMGQVRFAELLSSEMAREYPGYKFVIWGDPAGDTRVPTDEKTPFQILQARGIPANPAPTNDFTLRREAIAVPLCRLVDGKPGLLISPRCKVTRKGLGGGYCYRRLMVRGDNKYQNEPDKTMYSHPVEALGYALIGAGEGFALIKPPPKPEGESPALRRNSDWRLP